MGLKKYGLQLIRCIYSIEIIDFFLSVAGGRAAGLSPTGRSNNESAAATQRYDGEMEGCEDMGEGRRIRSVGLITTQRQKTLKFRAATANALLSVIGTRPEERQACEDVGAGFGSANITLRGPAWGTCSKEMARQFNQQPSCNEHLYNKGVMFVCLSVSMFRMAGQTAGLIETKLDTRTHVHPGSVSGKVNVKVIHVCVRD